MRLKHFSSILLLLIAVLISGCIGQKITSEYVCPDGSIVSDPIQCQTTTTTSTISTTTTLSPCSPCFSYFTYLDHGSDLVYLRNGPQKISIGTKLYNPNDEVQYYHRCSRSPCEVLINYKEFTTGLMRNDSAILHGSIIEIPCKPCFSFFTFVDYRPGILRIKNGQKNIMISSVSGGNTTDCIDESCAPGYDITIRNIMTTGDVQIKIDYVDVTRELSYSDVATILNA